MSHNIYYGKMLGDVVLDGKCNFAKTVLCPSQIVHAEKLVAVGPSVDRFEAGLGRHSAKVFDRVFVRILGVDQFTGGEAEAGAGDRYGLLGMAFQVQLHPPLRFIVEGKVSELIDIEIAAELAVDPRQQIEVEGGIDPGLVVIGGVEDFGVLLQIGADQHLPAGAEQGGPN